MTEEEIRYRVEATIEKIRPYIIRDGGDITLDRIEDGVVYVRVHGACIGCAAIDMTIKDGVEAILLDEIPELKEVRLANDFYSF